MMVSLSAVKDHGDQALNKRAVTLLRNYLAVAPAGSISPLGKVLQDFE